jgi:hypothetical protein
MRLLALQQNFGTWLQSESTEGAAQFGERARSGLAVYLNNYRAQLMSCLSASFPIVRAWIGETAFEAAAAHHIDNVPPHAWTLDAYGLDFPPADPEVAELACLERELAAAFVGRDAARVDPAALTGIDWDAAIIYFVPTFRLFVATTNVAAIWSAISNHEVPPTAVRLAEPMSLALWRDDLAPRFRTLSAEEAAVLSQVREGKTFGAICAALVERVGEESGAALAGSLLGQWLADHMVARIQATSQEIAHGIRG